MPNNLFISSNDTENGYIYKELISRINYLSQEIENIKNQINQLNIEGISFNDLVSIRDELNKKASIEYVQNHINNTQCHISISKANEWDNKYVKQPNGISENDLSKELQNKINR